MLLPLEGTNRIGFQFLCASVLRFPFCATLESDWSLAQVFLSLATMMMNQVDVLAMIQKRWLESKEKDSTRLGPNTSEILYLNLLGSSMDDFINIKLGFLI